MNIKHGLVGGALLAVLNLPTPVLAAPGRPVVVELFTSEACSDCPPADALLRRLKASDPNILPLSFHVTYWNGPAWTDRYSLQASTDRQDWYAGLLNSEMYTPETVVDGTRAMVGSDVDNVTTAISAAEQAAAAGVAVDLRDGATVKVAVAAGTQASATTWLIGYDDMHVTQVGGGENGGASLTEVNVVRSITKLGPWHGKGVSFSTARPAGMHLAVLVQRDDGGIEGAATD